MKSDHEGENLLFGKRRTLPRFFKRISKKPLFWMISLSLLGVSPVGIDLIMKSMGIPIDLPNLMG